MTDFDKSRPAQGDSSNMEVLGQVMWLMSQSTLHRRWHIESLFQWIIPALMHKQFRVYTRQQKPVAYVSWARLSESKESAYVLNPRGLQPVDWQSGDRIWVVDLISPFNATREVYADLRNNVFRNDVGRALRVKPGSDEMRIIYIHGSDAVHKARDRVRNPTVDITRNAVAHNNAIRV
jgi:cytolysin-activating lysine-acyltransferase